MIKLTAPMGWNSWNTFGGEINEKIVFETADRITELGLAEAGYEYLVIDDCWECRKRDRFGKLVANPEKFPNGMKAVADHLHKKGLKLGLYSCCGNLTCAGFPGSYGHEFTDAETFAEWEIDFLKYDYCYRGDVVPSRYLYRKMGLALENCGRDILFSACTWGLDNTEEWIKETPAAIWRSTRDIADSWDSIRSIVREQRKIHKSNSIGSFNDMDMLVVGMNGRGNVAVDSVGCTEEQYRTHFSAWAFFGSPLMIGCDLKNTDGRFLKMLTNKDLIRINQDPLCRKPFEIFSDVEDDMMVYARMLSNGEIAVAAFNFLDEEKRYYITFDQLGIPENMKLEMRNAWTGEVFVPDNSLYTNILKPCCCEVFICRVAD